MSYEYILEVLNKTFASSRPKILFVDIDGVLTVSRSERLLDLEAVQLLQQIYSLGVTVVLASGNSYPVVRGLSYYLGFRDGLIAENGCIIEVRGERLDLARTSGMQAAEELVKKFGLKLPRLASYYRYDIPLEGYEGKDLAEIKKFVSDKYRDLELLFSGVALHVHPKECSKGRAAKVVAEMLGLSLDDAIAIGDGETDVDMLRSCRLGVSVGDAEEEAKKAAKLVVRAPASTATKEFLRALIYFLLSARRI